MANIKSKARQLRLARAHMLGRPVTLQEVADATGISQGALSNIELGKTERIDFETLSRLCRFYEVGVGDILEYTEEIGRPDYAQGALAAA